MQLGYGHEKREARYYQAPRVAVRLPPKFARTRINVPIESKISKCGETKFALHSPSVEDPIEIGSAERASAERHIRRVASSSVDGQSRNAEGSSGNAEGRSSGKK